MLELSAENTRSNICNEYGNDGVIYYKNMIAFIDTSFWI